MRATPTARKADNATPRAAAGVCGVSGMVPIAPNAIATRTGVVSVALSFPKIRGEK